MDFSNRNILITGAADGLGFAVSKAFSEKKANLFLLDIVFEISFLITFFEDIFIKNASR